MARIKNEYGEDRIVPSLGDRLVLAGEVVEVPDEAVYGFTCQAGWSPADTDAREADTAADNEAAEVAVVESGDAEEPAGNAGRDAWVAWVVGKGLATEEDLDGKGRDEIRDTYKQEG